MSKLFAPNFLAPEFQALGISVANGVAGMGAGMPWVDR